VWPLQRLVNVRTVWTVRTDAPLRFLRPNSRRKLQPGELLEDVSKRGSGAMHIQSTAETQPATS
jgi:hypothetical protein